MAFSEYINFKIMNAASKTMSPQYVVNNFETTTKQEWLEQARNWKKNQPSLNRRLYSFFVENRSKVKGLFSKVVNWAKKDIKIDFQPFNQEWNYWLAVLLRFFLWPKFVWPRKVATVLELAAKYRIKNILLSRAIIKGQKI